MKEQLIECFLDTLELSKVLPLMRKNNIIYEENFVSPTAKKNEDGTITVCENTTFSSAKSHLQYGKVAALNFANPINPGGGVKNGAMAQEECLCRSSNLYESLCDDSVYQDYYIYNKNKSLLGSDRIIYTKNVTVFKNDDAIPKLMNKEDWFCVDVITSAAPYSQTKEEGAKKYLKDIFKNRIKNIFEVARDNAVDVLILGAFGCGAFNNSPYIVAAAFNEVIKENHYLKDFKKIVFAIKRSSLPPCDNLMAFQWEFIGVSEEANILRFTQ